MENDRRENLNDSGERYRRTVSSAERMKRRRRRRRLQILKLVLIVIAALAAVGGVTYGIMRLREGM